MQVGSIRLEAIATRLESCCFVLVGACSKLFQAGDTCIELNRAGLHETVLL